MGAATAIAVGGTGVGTASRAGTIRWQFDDGHVEELSAAEFRRRSDTPTFEELGGHPNDALDCCSCQKYPIDCSYCYYPPCMGDPIEQ